MKQSQHISQHRNNTMAFTYMRLICNVHTYTPIFYLISLFEHNSLKCCMHVFTQFACCGHRCDWDWLSEPVSALPTLPSPSRAGHGTAQCSRWAEKLCRVTHNIITISTLYNTMCGKYTFYRSASIDNLFIAYRHKSKYSIGYVLSFIYMKVKSPTPSPPKCLLSVDGV